MNTTNKMAVSNGLPDEESTETDLDLPPSFNIEDDDEDLELQGWISCKSSHNDNTKRQIKFGLSVFKEFSERVNKNFEDIDIKALDVLLSNFYRAARNKKGELYSKKSMQAIRFGLHRHFLESRGIDIMRRDEFYLSHKTFKAMIHKLRVHGKDKVRHHPPITEDDMACMQASLDLSKPKDLQYKVFLDTMLYFGKRGMKNLRRTRPGDFILHQENNDIFYTFGGNQQALMHAMPGNPRCPVTNLKKYISKLNFNCEWMWQRPKRRNLNDLDAWYIGAALGKCTLSSMTKTISESAGCYKGYSNHSLRISMTNKMLQTLSTNTDGSHDGNYAITVVTLPTSSNSLVARVNKMNTAQVSNATISGSSMNINMSQGVPGFTSFKVIQPRKQDNSVTSNKGVSKGTMTDLTWIALLRKLVQSKDAFTQWEKQVDSKQLPTHSATCTSSVPQLNNGNDGDVEDPDNTPAVVESMDSSETFDADIADESTMLPTEAGSECGMEEAIMDLTKKGIPSNAPIMRGIKEEIIDELEDADYQTIYIKEECLEDDCIEANHIGAKLSPQRSSAHSGHLRPEMNNSRSTVQRQAPKEDGGHLIGSKIIHRLKFHMTQGIHKQILTVNSPTNTVTGATINRAVCNTLQAFPDRLQVQYFDESWQDWVDIEQSMTLRGTMRLNVIITGGRAESRQQTSTPNDQTIHGLKYLVTLGKSQQILTVKSPKNTASGATIKDAVCRRLHTLADGLLLQYFDENWQEWIDVEPSTMFEGRMRLNVIQTTCSSKSQSDPNR